MSRFSRTPASLAAWSFGVIYLGAGILGFTMTGFHGFIAMNGPRLFGLFMVNPLHNTFHVVVAVVWLLAAPRHDTARRANFVFGCVFGLVTVLGFAHLLTILGIMGLGAPDNFLHLVSATLALYFGSIGAERLDAERADESGYL